MFDLDGGQHSAKAAVVHIDAQLELLGDKPGPATPIVVFLKNAFDHSKILPIVRFGILSLLS